jgi:hypothetical protein
MTGGGCVRRLFAREQGGYIHHQQRHGITPHLAARAKSGAELHSDFSAARPADRGLAFGLPKSPQLA